MTVYKVVEKYGVGPSYPMGKVSEKLILIAWDNKVLPKSQTELIALHACHANKSEPMFYSQTDSTFRCLSCGEIIPFDKILFRETLSLMSRGFFGCVVGHSDVATVRLIRLVKRVPFVVLEGNGSIFAIKQDESINK